MNHDEFMKRIIEETAAYLGVKERDCFAVWTCKTLQNSKALVSAYGKGMPYIEFTLNGDKNEIYMDIYYKYEQVLMEAYE